MVEDVPLGLLRRVDGSQGHRAFHASQITTYRLIVNRYVDYKVANASHACADSGENCAGWPTTYTSSLQGGHSSGLDKIRGYSYTKAPKDGFKEAKKKVLAALKSGSYLHEARNEIDTKNKLATGEVAASEVAELIRKSTGNDHSKSAHHANSSIVVHVISRKGWYIKFYFVDPDTWFISIHR